MPILIKSSNGQRKVQILSRNAEQKPKREQDLRSTLVSLLRGMTITLELKLNDVLVASSDSPINVEQASGMGVSVEQTVGLEEVAKSGTEKSQDSPKQIPAKNLEYKEQNLAQNSEPITSVETKTSLAFGPNQALKVKSDPREPAITPNPPAVIATQVVEEAEKMERKPTDELKTPTLVEPMQQLKVLAKPINKPPEVVKPNKPFLVRGDLKVGSAVTTVGLSLASEDPIVLYVTYDQKKLVESVIKIQDIADAIEAQSMIKSVDIGDIIFGKSNEDDAWYRGVVMFSEGQQIEVYFFDWGITETLDITRIRRLTELGLGLAKFPACAVKVRFTDDSKPYLNEVLACEKRFSMRVESYNQTEEVYTGTVTKILPDE